MERLKALLQYVQKKFGKKNGENEEEIGGYSMNEGQPDKVFGFRREIIKGVAIFFGSVLILALIFASSGDEEGQKELETLPQAKESEIADMKKPKNTLPNDYETLMAMNKAKEEELRRQAEENARNAAKPQPVTPPEPPTPTVVENTIPQSVPVIPESKVLPPVVQMPVLPEETPVVVTEKVEKIPQPTNDKYKSAISFGIGEDENKSASDKVSFNSKAQLEYSEPNELTLVAGTIIPVRLLTGIDTAVAGQVMAQVLSDVYDTATGTKLLIPQGSKLTGTYDKKSANNGRVPVTFNELVLPDGGSCLISENIVAVDGAGYTGIKGKVHHHTGQKISAGAIGASIAALGSLAAGNVSSSNETYTAGQIAAQGAVANMINTTSNLLKEVTDVENTVTIEPGYEFNVYVTENVKF